MKNDHFIILLVFWIVFLLPLTTLSDPSDALIDEDVNFEDIFSDLPENFDLKSAPASDFQKLPFFTEENAASVVRFRDTLGNSEDFISHMDDIPGLSPLQCAVLNHLSQMSEPSGLALFSGSIRNGVIHRPEKESLSESKYYFKLSSEKENTYILTLLGERDPYEQRALDLFSASVSLFPNNNRINVVIGDYRPGYGQGLVFSRYGRWYGNGADIVVHERKTITNTFFEESHFLRGSHITLYSKWFTTYVWTSLRKLDASIDEDGKVKTIKETGYHYSGEIRGNLKENISAVRIALTRVLPGIECAVSGVQTAYAPDLARRNGEQYLHDPQGKTFNYITVDGKMEKGSILLFFECASMDQDESAVIGGIHLKTSRVRSSVLVRHYSTGYWAPHSGSFSAFGKTSNEKGIYSGIQADLTRNLRMTASMDLARTLYRSYTSDMPFSRQRVNIAFQSRLFNGILGSISSRVSDDSENNKKRWNCSIMFERKPRVHTRWGWNSKWAWSDSIEKGGPFLKKTLYINLKNISIDLSTCLFDIPSYSSRFYHYERNVPGRGWTTPVWGRGGKIYILFKWNLLSGRYLYKDSDMNERSHEVTFQCDVAF
ncbi:MAG TPA: hypothetical protein VMZ04_06935 [Anaerolineae bacterium]|nr:hypothetical protein [Anaerolineae bacterium]